MKHLASIFIILTINILVLMPLSKKITSPGFIDSDYYFATARCMASNWSEPGKNTQNTENAEDTTSFKLFPKLPFLWNYLSGNDDLPTESNTYWMPMTNIIAWAGLETFSRPDDTVHIQFMAARLPFLMIAFLMPLLVYQVALKMNFSPTTAFISGIFSCFTGHYAPFLITTDSFAIMMLTGLFLFFIIFSDLGPDLKTDSPNKKYTPVCLGITAGIIHLTRAEGPVWLLIFTLYLFIKSLPYLKNFLKSFLVMISFYLLIMFPLFYRNFGLFKSLMPSGGIKGLWLVKYNDIFSYPSSILTFERWFTQDIGTLLSIRLKGLYEFFSSLIINQTLVTLFPFLVAGLYLSLKKSVNSNKIKSNKKSPEDIIKIHNTALFIIGSFFMLTTFFVLFFPLQGIRGSFFHASAIFQPAVFIFSAIGLEGFIAFGAKKREWNQGRALLRFLPPLVAVLWIITLHAGSTKIHGNSSLPPWNEHASVYSKIAKKLENEGINRPVVLINNPAGYCVYGNSSKAFMIPEGGLNALKKLIKKKKIELLIIEPEHPDYLDGIFNKSKEKNLHSKKILHIDDALILIL